MSRQSIETDCFLRRVVGGKVKVYNQDKKLGPADAKERTMNTEKY